MQLDDIEDFLVNAIEFMILATVFLGLVLVWGAAAASVLYLLWIAI